VELVHIDGFITKKKQYTEWPRKMYTLFTHQYKGVVCIQFLGPLCIYGVLETLRSGVISIMYIYQ
jgi:hypothetical protein